MKIIQSFNLPVRQAGHSIILALLVLSFVILSGVEGFAQFTTDRDTLVILEDDSFLMSMSQLLTPPEEHHIPARRVTISTERFSLGLTLIQLPHSQQQSFLYKLLQPIMKMQTQQTEHLTIGKPFLIWATQLRSSRK